MPPVAIAPAARAGAIQPPVAARPAVATHKRSPLAIVEEFIVPAHPVVNEMLRAIDSPCQLRRRPDLQHGYPRGGTASIVQQNRKGSRFFQILSRNDLPLGGADQLWLHRDAVLAAIAGDEVDHAR